jgi:hypothetical protein
MTEPTDEPPLQPPRVLADMLLGAAMREVLISLLVKVCPAQELESNALDAAATAAATREAQAAQAPGPDAPLGEVHASAIMDKIAAIYGEAAQARRGIAEQPIVEGRSRH